MRIAVLVPLGLAAVAIGASIRDCTTQAQMLSSSWCGDTPPTLATAAHAHCVGCGFIAAGLAALLVAFGVAVRRRYMLATLGARS